MAVSPNNVDISLVKRLIPLDTLSLNKIEEILGKAALQKVAAGKMLFKQGDRDKWTVYLLEGEINLSASDSPDIVIKAGNDNALKPIAKGIPRTHTAIAKTSVLVLIIDTELLNVLLNWNSSNSIEVTEYNEEEDDDDWMTRFLQSNAFIQLPASNMQALLMKLEEVPLAKGKMVIKEGDKKDQNYYIIKQGQCIVSRIDPNSGKAKPLAILKSGVGFGEEALITDTERGATVSMRDDGSVMKLAKHDFIELIVKPLLHIISQTQLNALEDEHLCYIDVRSKIEHKKNGVSGSKHCPIRNIRDDIANLDPELHYIVYSSSENRSSSAAFLFIQQGLEVSVLRDGVGSTGFTDEEIQASIESEESKGNVQSKSKPKPQANSKLKPQIEQTQQEKPESSKEQSNNGESKNSSLSEYKQKLEQSEQARLDLEANNHKLKAELEKIKQIAIKDTKLAKNAIQLLKKSDVKIKALEAEIKILKV